MDRFFLPPDQWTTTSLSLTGEEAHHAVRVMRKKVGDEVEVFDGQGRWARGEVAEARKSSLVIVVKEEGQSEPLSPQLTLAVAVPKGKTMDLIVQKAVELGVNRLQPLQTTNSVVKVDPKEAKEKSRKWQRVALEACKQCGQNFLPQVAPIATLRDYVTAEKAEHRLIASLAPGARNTRMTFKDLPKEMTDLALLVGPEGDFTNEEVEEALNRQFLPVTLGKIVLRVETACFFLVSVASSYFR